MKKKAVKKKSSKKVAKHAAKKKTVSRKVVRKKLTKRKIVTKKHIKHHRIRKKNLTPRAGTGISAFDKMIKGGFDRESINLIAGGSGSGKTIFALQFLLEGIKRGEKTLYVTFEENKEEFYDNMKKIGLDLDEAEKGSKFIFLEYSPEKVKMMLDEGGGAIETIILREGIKRMVIDSVTSFSLLFDDELTKRQSILALFDMIRKWDCTTLFTVQFDPQDKRDKEISSIEFEADSITVLHFVNVRNKRERFIEVLKMRGTDHAKEIRAFKIGKGGIKIGRRANVKGIV